MIGTDYEDPPDWQLDPDGIPPRTATLAEVHATFRRWLGDEYDLDALDVVLASAAVEHLGGDPVWLLLISGPGNAKTETVGALHGAGAFVTSTITSEGALLSATAKKEASPDATGGLLRKIGDRGTVVIKDFTSIISMNREARAAVLGALREVYDGKWERNVGTDGGRTLTWTGRLVVIGACTTAYDSAHAVISSMGDRFALCRMDSSVGRQAAGRQALMNVDHEVQMRSELAAVVGAVLGSVDAGKAVLSEHVMGDLLSAADLVTLSRTAVLVDGTGDPIEAHAPEMPTRFAKMLGQIVRGCLAIGMTEQDALRCALRVARDSSPPMRIGALEYVRANPWQSTRAISRGMGKPSKTVDRCLAALELLGLVHKDDGERGAWIWNLSDLVDMSAYDLIERAGFVGRPKDPSLNRESTSTDVTDAVGLSSVPRPR